MPDFAKQDGWEKEGSQFLLHRYHGIKSMSEYPPSIPMVCGYHMKEPFSTKNETPSSKCFFNKISIDGMHWCVETLGPYYSANIACLLGCVYNEKGPQNSEEIRYCEQECNDHFMTLVPIDESWIGSNTTIYSKNN